jgi:outer membrane immunogenic protein
MKRFYVGAASALALVTGLTAGQANAQGFRGIRVEAQAGLDRFYSEGNHHDKLGWGGAAGADFDLGGFVLGPEVTFWWAPNENKTIEGGGLAERKSFEEWALALRAGVNIGPSTLVYGKVGYVRNEQRKRFTPINPANGLLDSSLPGGYYDHYKTNGWQWGAGINQMLGSNFYVSAEGRYSDYNNKHHLGGTHRIVGLIGLGYLFGGATAEAPPPPPPPPPPPAAPATQTCPDGSVILATSTCPVPPPPPPPPPVERGERG